MVSRKPFLLSLGCGNTDGSVTEWSVFASAEPPSLFHYVSWLFKRPATASALQALWAHVKELVEAIPAAKNIAWG